MRARMALMYLIKSGRVAEQQWVEYHSHAWETLVEIGWVTHVVEEF